MLSIVYLRLYLLIQHLQRRADVPQRVGHSGVPRGAAGHLRGMIGNDHALETSLLEDSQNAEDIDIPFVDERFLVMGHFAATLRKWT